MLSNYIYFNLEMVINTNDLLATSKDRTNTSRVFTEY